MRFDAYRLSKFGNGPTDELHAGDVLSFLTYLVIERKGSAKSLDNDLSQLRCYWANLGRRDWLDARGEREVKAVLNQFQLEDQGASRRKAPLTAELLDKMDSILRLSNEQDLLFSTMCWLGNQGLFRGGELCSGLRMSDVEFAADYSSVDIYLSRTKTVRKGDGVRVTVGDVTGVSAVKRLVLWVTRKGLVEGSDQLLFPSYATTSWLRGRIQKAMGRLGLNGKRFGNHSLRAGGATDLFVARVPYPCIKKMGRWESDAALIYYRDDEHVQAEVREGRERLRAGRKLIVGEGRKSLL